MAMVDIHVAHWDKVFEKLQIGRRCKDTGPGESPATSTCHLQQRLDENLLVKTVLILQTVLLTLLFVLQANLAILYGYSDTTSELWKFVTYVYFAATTIFTFTTMKLAEFLPVACFLQTIVVLIAGGRTMLIFYVKYEVIDGSLCGIYLWAFEVIITFYYGLTSVLFLYSHLNLGWSFLRRGRRVDNMFNSTHQNPYSLTLPK